MSWHRLAKLGGQRSGPSHQPSASLAFCFFWAEGATRCRWYLGLRDRQALGCHAHLRVDAASALVVPCSAAADRDGLSGLGAARRKHHGAAGRRATADRRVATFSPSLRFLRHSLPTFPAAPAAPTALLFASLIPTLFSAALLLSQSSYFWPLGMVAPSRDLAAVNCSLVHPLASVRLALARSA